MATVASSVLMFSRQVPCLPFSPATKTGSSNPPEAGATLTQMHLPLSRSLIIFHPGPADLWPVLCFSGCNQGQLKKFSGLLLSIDYHFVKPLAKIPEKRLCGRIPPFSWRRGWQLGLQDLLPLSRKQGSKPWLH